ncbi:hypothetical protein GCM10010495_18130 [Kitasatospora herbaricolor]|uniref:hypothetical protein n=1 Tax=Kitasatospora herbaricolor TaxID=68217 RepID=UPI00174EBC76|nr:hypothetical protein [Kitasatospora herbaricolor]MDQ0308261.1 hypothetical protein [Kitasatospora herbaricolor]GGV06354.1 hypothetical protein GCM10010495_18130 [Kitasatospora herbaricolor]
MKKTDAGYPDALAATVQILRAWAAEGREATPKTYTDLSSALRERNVRDVPPHGGIMPHLLEDASLWENEDGRRPMLSALVTSKELGMPSIGFFELAARSPFSRPLRGAELWERERDAVHAEFARPGRT